MGAFLLRCALVGACSISTVVLADSAEVSGQLRGYWIDRPLADAGPLAQANRLQPGIAATTLSVAALQAELHGNARVDAITLNSTATLQTRSLENGASDIGRDSDGWVNEAYASGKALGWQWSVGRKVVSWDVGYAFRPNDVVQQESRRTLAAEALTGRPLLMAEHFDADTAWSLVWVNPIEPQANVGAQEAALAARVYQRSGAVDWHGFARQGEHTGTSVGMAAAWVASEAIELHASVRAYQHVDSSVNTNTGSSLSTTSPWQPTLAGAGQQILVGGTYTNAAQVSLLVEAWHDETALTDAQWSAWTVRNQALPLWLARSVPAIAVAGNLAWQSNAFGLSNSLRQDNVFARITWQRDRWQTAMDVLYAPADKGTIATVSVIWSGEHFKIETGLRVHGGPDSAVVRQLAVQRQIYMAGSWAF